MRTLWIIFAAVMVLSISVHAVGALTPSECKQSLLSRLEVGGFASLAPTGDSTPSLIAGGPRCTDGIYSWRVRTPRVPTNNLEDVSTFQLQWLPEVVNGQYNLAPAESPVTVGEAYSPSRVDLSQTPTSLAIQGLWQISYSGSAAGGTTPLDDGAVAVGVYKDEVISVFPGTIASPVRIRLFQPGFILFAEFDGQLLDRGGSDTWVTFTPPTQPGLPTGIWVAEFIADGVSQRVAYELRPPDFLVRRDLEPSGDGSSSFRDLLRAGMSWACEADEPVIYFSGFGANEPIDVVETRLETDITVLNRTSDALSIGDSLRENRRWALRADQHGTLVVSGVSKVYDFNTPLSDPISGDPLTMYTFEVRGVSWRDFRRTGLVGSGDSIYVAPDDGTVRAQPLYVMPALWWCQNNQPVLNNPDCGTSLAVGCTAQVNVDDDGLKLREGTSTQSTILETMPDGAFVDIDGGPVSEAGYTWWLVKFGNTLGWSVESADGLNTLIPAAGGIQLNPG